MKRPKLFGIIECTDQFQRFLEGMLTVGNTPKHRLRSQKAGAASPQKRVEDLLNRGLTIQSDDRLCFVRVVGGGQ